MDDPAGVVLLVLTVTLAWLSALRAFEGIPRSAYWAGATTIGVARIVATGAYSVTVIGSCDTSLADACATYELTPTGYLAMGAVLGIAASALLGAFAYLRGRQIRKLSASGLDNPSRHP